MFHFNSFCCAIRSFERLSEELVYVGFYFRYKLLAFISHMGNIPQSGHYVCHIKVEVYKLDILPQIWFSSHPFFEKIYFLPLNFHPLTPLDIYLYSLNIIVKMNWNPTAIISFPSSQQGILPQKTLTNLIRNFIYTPCIKDVEKGRWIIYNDNKVAVSEKPPKEFGYIYLYARSSWFQEN